MLELLESFGETVCPSEQTLWERGLQASDGERKSKWQVAGSKEGPKRPQPSDVSCTKNCHRWPQRWMELLPQKG